jgi:allantoinase
MPDFDLIIKGGNLVTPEGVQRADVAISAGNIAAVAPHVDESAAETIDATGVHVFPGLIDVHVHFNDPGRADWEGAPTGSAALAAGGGTCFFDMPLNSSPPVLDAASFDAKLHALTGNSHTDFALWGGLTPQSLENMDELAAKGVVGFKAFMCESGIDDFQRADDWTLERGMRKAARLGLPVAVHAENQELVAGKTEWLRERLPVLTAKDWVYSRSPLAEADAIQRALLIARFTGCKLHIVHISNRYCIDLASRYRPVVDVSLETCPHYFSLSAEEVESVGPAAKCAPPIRIAEHTHELWDALRQGQVDIVASDHSPSPPSMKDTPDFFSAWGGISGVQSTLSALLTRRPELPLDIACKLTNTNPAHRFRIPQKGRIARNFDADFTLVDLSAQYDLTRDMLLDRHKLSPYVGHIFRGKIVRTILRGQTIFLDGKIIGGFTGKFVRPAAVGARGQSNV